MQNANTSSAPVAFVLGAAATEAPTEAPASVTPATAKPAPAPAVAAPAADTDRSAERLAARTAIADYYSGAGKSIPFKAASDTFAEIRLDKAPKAATTRQAALLAAMLIAGDNVKPNGNFVRGGFTFDGKHVQPETGCLSDMLGRTIKHISGPLTGKQAREAIFRIDLARARTEISAHLGDKLGKQALAKLDKLNPPKPAKAA